MLLLEPNEPKKNLFFLTERKKMIAAPRTGKPFKGKNR
jgi:hypothetical protein